MANIFKLFRFPAEGLGCRILKLHLVCRTAHLTSMYFIIIYFRQCLSGAFTYLSLSFYVFCDPCFMFVLYPIPKHLWQLWDSNPRPFGLVPKTSALDHSAKLPWISQDLFFELPCYFKDRDNLQIILIYFLCYIFETKSYHKTSIANKFKLFMFPAKGVGCRILNSILCAQLPTLHEFICLLYTSPSPRD